MDRPHNPKSLYLLLGILAATFILFSTLAVGTGEDTNYRNVSVTTQVNITNSFPEVISVTPDTDITLNAGGTQVIECNATVRDFDGIGSVTVVNATFFDMNNASFGSADDNNNHYTNTSCTQYANTTTTGNYTCQFPVQYYANNGTNWNCTVRVQDDKNTTDNNSALTDINRLLALNVSSLIDYGNLAVTQTSGSQEANVTNLGNVQINVSVYGYGNQSDDGLAMVCDQGNISIDQEKYSLNSSLNWGNMTALTSTNQTFSNLSLTRRTVDSPGGEIVNSTYWRLRVPASSNPNGQCNGTIIFQAEQS